MQNKNKTKDQLHGELAHLRKQVAEYKIVKKELSGKLSTLEEAQRRTKTGNWKWYIPTNTFTWSKELYSIFGVDEKSYIPSAEAFVELVHPDDASYVLSPETYEKNNRAGKYEMEYRVIDQTTKQTKYVHLWGEVFHDLNGSIVGNLGTFQDITEQRRLEEQLRQSQKMDAIGTLAGGIAHDFNNLLVPILGYSQLAKVEFELDSEMVDYLDIIEETAIRAKDLVAKILAISRSPQTNTDSVQLKNLIEEVLTVLRASISKDIEIHLEIDLDLSPISANPSQIYQVILNLCTNAVHAMQEEGDLWIKLNKINPSVFPHIQKENQNKEFICLSVQDNGCGMDAATLERIYEPFFTTKKRGGERGTGLGLSIASSVVKQYKGHMEVESDPGVGTVFRVYFPTLMEAKSSFKKESWPSVVSGNDHILFVDDEKVICDMGTSILKKLGYRVTNFTDSQEALRAFEANPQDFQLVVTDYSMPWLTGPQLTKKIKAVSSNIPILLVTGYSNLATPDNLHELNCDGIIAKPYNIEKLSQMVSQALQKAKS